MLNDARCRELHEHFVSASRVRGPARAEYQQQLRARDAELADELEHLLAALTEVDDRDDAEPALFELVGAATQAGARLQLGALAGAGSPGSLQSRIDGFQLIRQLGQGGMGVVFEAEQEAPRRRVALKLMQPSLGTERQRRFELEAAVLGRLHHPNIAQIYAYGTCRGPLGEQPYFAMELVDGVDLRTHVERNHLALRDQLELFAQVVDGVQHAHERGIVHRDLKPENVLVDRHGIAKVLDFGVARAADSSLDLASMATREGEIIGTLSYMAPEQLAGNSDAVTARSDVYSLGVMLYELLARRLPHVVAGLPVAAAIHVLTNTAPVPLARADARYRGDLATLVDKAMAADPARRYASAAELAADIRRHLDHLPIHARPASISYRLTTMLRRNRAIASGLAAAFGALLLGLGGTAWQARVAAGERDASQRQAYSANLFGAGDSLARAEFAAARGYLTAAPEALRGFEWRLLSAMLETAVEVHARSLPRPLGTLHRDYVLRSAAGGRSYWTLDGSAGAVARGWDRATGRQLAALPARIEATPWTVSADGRQLFQIRRDPADPRRCGLLTWDTETATLVRDTPFELPASHVSHALWPAWPSPDGSWVALTDDGAVSRIDLRGGPVLRRELPECVNATSFVRFRPDGRLIALPVPAPGQPVLLLDGSTLQTVAKLVGHENSYNDVQFSADGTLLVTASSDQCARLWDLATEPPTCRFVLRHPLSVDSATFSPDRRRLATACRDRMIRVFAVADGTLLATFGSSDLVPGAITFLDDETIAGADANSTVRQWVVDANATTVLRGPRAPVEHLLIARQFGLLVAAGLDGARGLAGSLRFWDLESGDPVLECMEAGAIVSGMALSGDGASLDLVVRGANSVAPASDFRRIDLRTGALTLDPLTTPGAHGSFAPDGQRLAGGSYDGEQSPTNGFMLFDRRTGGVWRNSGFPCHRATWSHDGSRLFYTSRKPPRGGPGGAIWIDPRALREVRRYPGDGAMAIALSADESRLAIAGDDGVVRVFDVESGERLAELRGHDLEVYCLAFSPDGKRLASAGLDRAIRLWGTEHWEPVARISGHEDAVMAIVWDGDERLVSCGGDDTVRIWETTPVRTRVAARAARRAALARMEPLVAAWFAELGDGARVYERIAADPSLGDLDRKVAHQVALRIGLAKAAVK